MFHRSRNTEYRFKIGMNQLFEGGPQTVSLRKLMKMELYVDPDRQVEIQYIYIYLWVV